MTLTTEEKDLRRLAKNARNRAHRARCRDRARAEDIGKSEITSRLGPEIEAASVAEDALLAERNAALGDIDRAICELQDKKKAVQEDFASRIIPLHDKMRALIDLRNSQHRQLDIEINAKFPDLVGAARWSAACWKPIT